ncbi:uncharacterized protein LOC129951723 [Eupeodes corollae]|uniref:uncharacterized protein LOC129951723 n=1 Tax=Eupeodes corollae TaxID=290404 RepID=UPI0024934BDD|nr:uncharacterized protein LOC129951723 [Eupeodes corollae]
MFSKLENKSNIILVVLLLINFTCGLEKWVKSAGVANLDCPLDDDPFNPTCLPYPGDCTKFIKCSYGLGYTLSCPAGLHWSKPLSRCEAPGVACCNSNAVTTPPVIGGGGCTFQYKPHPTDCNKLIQCVNGIEYELTCPQGSFWDKRTSKCSFTDYPRLNESYLRKYIMLRLEKRECFWIILTIFTSVSAGLAAEETALTPTCSKSSGSTLSFIPHPVDCRKYYVCVQGIAYLLSCSFGLNWVPSLGKCSALSSCANKQINKPPTYNPLCPIGANPTYLPDNHDCGKFFECHGGLASHMKCPEQYHWSVEHRRCVDPSVANCKSLSETISNGQLNPACPLNDDSYHPIHLPHPGDCTKFLKCSFGRSFIVSCPYGLHWNLEANRCDSPFVAQCGETIDTIVPPTTPSVSTIKPSTSQPSSNAKPNANIPICPTNGVKNFGIPGQCDKYFSCSQGKLYVTTCRAGRQWSEKANGCVDSSIAKCTGLFSAPITTLTTLGAPSSISASSSSSLLVPRPQTALGPTMCTPGVRFLPHPTDCQKHFLCDNGRPVEMPCPEGLYFSRSSSNCQWTNVDC